MASLPAVSTAPVPETGGALLPDFPDVLATAVALPIVPPAQTSTVVPAPSAQDSPALVAARPAPRVDTGEKPGGSGSASFGAAFLAPFAPAPSLPPVVATSSRGVTVPTLAPVEAAPIPSSVHAASDRGVEPARSAPGRASAELPLAGLIRRPGFLPAAGRLRQVETLLGRGIESVTPPALPGAVANGSAGSDATVPARGVPSAAVLRTGHAVAMLAAHDGGSMTVRLEPDALGPVRVRVEVADGVVRAHVTTSTESARAMLDTHLGTLRAGLERQGFVVEQLVVSGPPEPPPDPNLGSRSGERGDPGRQDAGHGSSRGRGDEHPPGRPGARSPSGAAFASVFTEAGAESDP